ncbi:MAG TPA: SRPBCC family protein [Mycobacteriales bacterium]|nr:SRPBCC family protein [Mycobacteriales bacterium]
MSGTFPERTVATVRRTIAAPPEDVWSVLADGWSFAVWVVGACRVRNVDPDWPDPGEAIHHSFGIWPALVNDDTVVVSAEPARELVLRAKAWPAGEAVVRLELTPDGPGATLVTIQEDATAGPVLLLPAPLRRLALHPRNVETLRRLAFLAEGRHRERLQRRP